MSRIFGDWDSRSSKSKSRPLAATQITGDKSGFIFIDDKILDESIKYTIEALRKEIGRELSDKIIKDVFIDKAKIFRFAMKGFAPKSKKDHKLKYAKRKKSTLIKSGNLRRSFTVFPAEGLSVEIGARRKGAKYGDKKADGFYGFFVNYGIHRNSRQPKQQFIERAYEAKGEVFGRLVLNDIDRRVKRVNRKMNGTGT